MLRSVLQRFGLTVSRRPAEPLQSRADHNTQTAPSQGPAADPAQGHPRAASAQKPVGKAPVVKVTAKPPVKPKTPLKTAVKIATQAAQPAARAKTAIKTVVKVVAPAKPADKSLAAGRSAITKSAVKPASKPVLEVPAKPPAIARTAAKAVPAATAGKKPLLPATAPAPEPIHHPIERFKSMTQPVALKPGRRSSARAPSQLPPPAPMVPTHAPDAAKASYSVMTERVMAPPPHVAAKKDPKLANNWKTKPAAELSDDEVKAMPDAEYMNDKQMAFFRHKLSVLKQEIHNSAGETTEHLREETVVVPDPADRATIEEEHALELRTRDRERKLLKKIEQSIGRIDSGDYGYCDETGEPIGVGRLIARPTANLSLEAQQRRELKQKMFGD